MSKLKNIFTNWRVIIVFISILLALVAIYPNPWAEGVAIRSIKLNSSAALAGIQNPNPGISPMSREVITAINNKPVANLGDYYEMVSELISNKTVTIKTNKDMYRLLTKEAGAEDLGLTVYNAPKNNIRKGLDLEGGTRVLLQPETKLSKDDMATLIDNMKQRLNVFGLADINVKEVSDLSGNQYIMIEIAGAQESEVKDLISKEGKFEAKIGNSTVFVGGKKDITHVCRSADCAGIDPMAGCGKNEAQWFCRFRFAISLAPEAAQRQADATKDLAITTENKEEYLSQKLYLYLDDVLVDELNIAADLKGKAATDIQITGSGAGMSQEEAVANSLENMKRLQTILITGSLPVKLKIVKTDTLSALFGKELLGNSLFIGLIALVAVSASVFLRYRKIQLVIPIIMTSLTELLLMLGVAAAIGWNIDLAAIAGIIISIGTGVNDQIIITDETLRGSKTSQIYNWKERIKNAFFIVFGAYFTLLAAMVPLYFAGAGLLKGFAVTSIIGLSAGVFITRPAYANLVEILVKE